MQHSAPAAADFAKRKPGSDNRIGCCRRDTPVARISNMDAELKEYLDAMERRTEQREQSLREYIDERTHDAETRIVRAFSAYQQSNGTRMRRIEADLSNVDTSTTQQMDAFQSKLLELETRIITLEKPNA